MPPKTASKSTCATSDVVSALSSAATTTSETARLVQALLGVEIGSSGIKSAPKRRLNASSRDASNRSQPLSRTAPPRPLTAAKFQVLESQDSVPASLGPKARKPFATEVFNKSLKCLSDGAKLKQALKEVGNISERVTSEKLSRPSSPLKPCSPNKDGSKTRAVNCSPKNEVIDYGAVGHCAVLSWNYLSQTSAHDNCSSAQTDRLKQGALVLLEKLISVALQKEAIEHAQNLHALYLAHKELENPSKNSLSARPVDLGQLLVSHGRLDSVESCTFVMSFQSQIIRLIVLRGKSAVTEQFLQAIRKDRDGSPAAVIMAARQDGLVDADKAGIHLHILSQALLKIYAQSHTVASIGGKHSLLSFSLLAQALAIKCAAWLLVGHRADLERELWSHVRKGIKTILQSMSKCDRNCFQLVVSEIQTIRVALQAAKLPSIIPATILLSMADCAEDKDSRAEIFQMLQALSKQRTEDSSDALALSIQLLTLGYSIDGSRNTNLLQNLSNCSSRLMNLHRSVQLDRLMMQLATLRKTCQKLADELSIFATTNVPEDLDRQISVCCIQLLIKLQELMGDHARNTMAQAKSVSDLATSRAITAINSFSKCVSALIDLPRNNALWPHSLTTDYHDALQLAIQMSTSIKTRLAKTSDQCELQLVVDSILVRLSACYWSRYVQGGGDAKPSAKQFLETSISALADLPIQIKEKAALSLKLEKLAVTCLQLEDFQSSRRTFEQLINFSIQAGAADDAANSALHGPSRAVWTRSGSPALPLGRALSCHAKLALTHNLNDTSTQTWLYDDVLLSPSQRCIILEAQLIATKGHTFTQPQVVAFAAGVDQVWRLASIPSLEIYRMRFASNLLRLIAESPELLSAKVFSQEMMDDMRLRYPGLSSQHKLFAFSTSLMSNVEMQWAMQCGRVDHFAIEASVASISSVIARTSKKEELEHTVDDIDFVDGLLTSVLSYSQMLDNATLSLKLLEALQGLYQLRGDSASDKAISVAGQLGRHYDRLGCTAKARSCFKGVNGVLENKSVTTLAHVKFRLYEVEFLLNDGRVRQSQEVFERAEAGLSAISHLRSPSSSKERMERDAVVALAARVASDIAFARGDLALATRCSRQTVKISTSIWGAIESLCSDPAKNSRTINVEAALPDIETGISALHLSGQQPQQPRQCSGARYWALAQLHLLALSQASRITIHLGLYQDGYHYAYQLKSLSAALKSGSWVARSHGLLGFLQAKSGKLADAAQCLDKFEGLKMQPLFDDFEVGVYAADASLELSNIEQAESLLQGLKQMQSLIHQANEDNSKQGTQETVENGTKPIRGRPKKAATLKQAPKRGRGHAVPPTTAQPKLDLENQMTRHQTYLAEHLGRLERLISLKKSEAMESLISLSHDISALKNASLSVRTIEAISRLKIAFQKLSSDAVKCVLAETAVALPVQTVMAGKRGRVSLVQAIDMPKTSTRSRVVKSKDLLANSSSVTAVTPGEQLIIDAYDLVSMRPHNDMNRASTEFVHLASKLQSKISLLSSTMDVPFSLKPTEIVLQSLLPKDTVLRREHAAIQADRDTKDKSQVLNWPCIKSALVDESLNLLDSFGASSVPDLEDIPPSWNVISLSLSDDHQELLASKIVAGRSPFSLRVPLARPDFDDEEAATFDFETAKAELAEIVDHANKSCHDSRGQGDKQARASWYAEREALDRRLEAWLSNVENIWLGGFRSLVSSHQVDQDLLILFGRRLEQSLATHLPSRQRSAGGASKKIELHAHVLELFIGLGSPEDKDLDDAVTDLLYFVVDILQFAGERNAYDEIDFDAILVEVYDALKTYHEQATRTPPRHTILVVDKEMAAIPWECLPCMQSAPVSRMPSLGSIIARVKVMRQQSVTSTGFQLSRDHSRGAYMLNPSGDLLATQSTFVPILQGQLARFSASIGSAPTEIQFESSLRSNDLFLYFGHGSGAQYIRGRTIRALDQCAATLLMGCSSVKMTECGKLESYGMPGYYMGGMSKCMAVVGTLWDVTDRDIDRFALKTMVEWGLIDEDENVSKVLERSSKKTTARSKGAGKIGTTDVQRHPTKKGAVSLIEAVQRGRDACLLKYLNGAAPVVYGVPVYLT